MTPKDLKLCDSDYKFMTAVWESCPVNSGELVRLCNERFGWKKSTVLYDDKENGTQRIRGKRQCHRHRSDSGRSMSERREEAQYFMERTFRNSMSKFFAAFFGDRKTSEERS